VPHDVCRAKNDQTREITMHYLDVAVNFDSPTAPDQPVICVVDSDFATRRELEGLIRSFGWQSLAAASAEEFLTRPRIMAPTCLLLDPELPGLCGLELQRLVQHRTEMPVIFMGTCPDLSLAVQAMKAGAFEFLEKPLQPAVLKNVLTDALQRSRAVLPHATQGVALQHRYETLTLRERAVMDLVVRGRLNKQIGTELGISEVTVKAHRGQAMRKMQAGSVAELVNISARLPRCTAQHTTDIQTPRGTTRSNRYVGAMQSYASVG
jgi:FixJ family two-component response regulator